MFFTVLGMNGPYAAAGGAGSGYLLRDDEMKENILLDCGPGVVARLQKYIGLRSLSGVVLSHLHYDHMSDMLALQYALGNWENPLRVVAPEGPKPVWTLLNAPCFQLQAPMEMELKGFHFEFIPAVHPVPAVSMAISRENRRMVYTGDTNLNSEMKAFAKGADLLVADGAFLMEEWAAEKPHMAAAHCARLAQEAGVKRLVITHFAPDSDRMWLLKQAAEIFPEVILASEGLTLSV